MKPAFQREPMAASATYYQTAYQQKSLWSRFIEFCEGEDEKRHFGWVGISLGAHGCVLTPLTLFAIILTANLLGLWMAAAFSMALVVIVNLAGLSTKYTIPVLLMSTLINIGVIIAAFTIG
jgi:hypothetical protein